MENVESVLTVGAAVDRLRQQFGNHGVTNPMLDARVLVGGLLGLDLTAMVIKQDRLLSGDEERLIAAAANRRCRGEPVYRILGMREFFGLDFALCDATLEPRPDTEIVVETALPIARSIAQAGVCHVLDLGTGSGAICLALLSEIAEARGVATDVSANALNTARDNAIRLGLADRFKTIESNWFDAVDGVFDLVVSNPPYIPSSDIALLDAEVRDHDPRGALDGGVDGLDAYRAIASAVAEHLTSRGYLILETGFDQHEAVITLFEAHGFVCTERVRDLGGKDRVLVFQRAEKRV